MKFLVEINCDKFNDHERRNAEVRRLLREITKQLPSDHVSQILTDSDGKRVGTARWRERSTGSSGSLVIHPSGGARK